MHLVVLLLLAGPILLGQSILRVPTGGPPLSLDPLRYADPGHLRFFAQVFEGPLEMGLDAKGVATIQPAVCELPAISEDGLLLDFAVRAGARFHDDPAFPEGKGRDATAEDLRFTLLRHADPAWKSPFWILLEGKIAGLDAWRQAAIDERITDYGRAVEGLAADGRILRIKLTEPYPQLPALLTQPWAGIVPREAIDAYGSAFGEKPVGTGPFRFSEWDALGTVKLARHPGYRIPGRPRVDELRFEVVEPGAKQLARFLDGQLHIIDTLGPNQEHFHDKLGRFRESVARKGITLAEGVPLQIHYVLLNCENRFLGKVAVRTAIALAIDRPRMIREFFGHRALLADSPVPPSFSEAPSVDVLPYALSKRDVPRARALLAEAGHPEGKGLPEFVFDAPGAATSETSMAQMRRFQEELAEIGIRIQVRAEAFDVYLNRVANGDTQLAWLSWFADYPDVENFLLLFRSARDGKSWGYNYGRYKNPKVDALYDRVARLYPGPLRTTLTVDLVKEVRADVPWVFLAYPLHSIAVQKGVTGFRFNLLNHSLRDVALTGR